MDIMRDAEAVAHRARVADVAARAAAAGAADRLAMIVELERDADRLRARARGERRHDGRIDPARHGDNDALAREIGAQLEIGFGHDDGRSIGIAAPFA